MSCPQHPQGPSTQGPTPASWPGSCLVLSPVGMPPSLPLWSLYLITFPQVTKCQDFVFPFFEGHVCFLSLNPQVPVPSLFSKTCYNFPQTPECSHFISSNLCGFVSEQWYFIIDWLLINSLEIPMLGPPVPRPSLQAFPAAVFAPRPGLALSAPPLLGTSPFVPPGARSQGIAIPPCLPGYPLLFWLAKIVPRPTPLFTF